MVILIFSIKNGKHFDGLMENEIPWTFYTTINDFYLSFYDFMRAKLCITY